MRHRFQGLPSLGWLNAFLRPNINRRVTFELSEESHWHKLLVMQGAFVAGIPIHVDAVFSGIWKRPEGWPSGHGPVGVVLRFRKVEFRQGDVKARHLLARTHRSHGEDEIEFGLSEARGLGMAERIQSMLPRLGHTPAGIRLI